MKKPLKKLLDDMIPSVPEKKKGDFSVNMSKLKKATYGDDIRKPYVQSNTYATNAQEDSDIQVQRDWKTTPSSRRELYSQQNPTPAPFMPMGKGPSFNVGAGLAASMAALAGILPDNSTRKPRINEPLVYNPYSSGTGSQAIMEDGGYVKKKKKANYGMNMGGGDPVPTVGGFPEKDKNVYYSDLLNKSILANAVPSTHESGRALLANKLTPLADAVALFNKRPGIDKLQGEDRINAFYNWNTGNPAVEEYKRQFKNINYAPAVDARTTPFRDVTAKPTLARMKSGGTISKISENPHDGGVFEFNGPSHANGGIDMAYAGKHVEVEGGETAFKDSQGNLTIAGNMIVPGSNKKFKNVIKDIAKAEEKLNILKDNGVKAIIDADYTNKMDKFKFNAGKVMLEGAQIGQEKAAEKKQMLASLQRSLLDTAEEFNLDPEALSKGAERKAKKGTWIKNYAAGGGGGGGSAKKGRGDGDDPKKKDSVAIRHNNPGNIKYGEFAKKLGAVPGDPATDGGVFAKFPSVEVGMQALRKLIKTKNYVDLPVEDALKRWTGGTGYATPLGELRGKKIRDLNPAQMEKLVNTITYGEDGRYYNDYVPKNTPAANVQAPTVVPEVTPLTLPQNKITFQPTTPTVVQEDVVAPPLQGLEFDERQPLPSNAERLKLTQILPELIGFAQNQQENVPLQRYEPDIFSPYQVSFQDRINRNQGNFNRVSEMLGGNVAAQSALAGQLYDANNQVAADQFRTNQGIASDIANKNVGILNDAKLRNLQLADTQMVRQSQAKSNTKAQNNVILNSIRDKFAANTLQNRRLQVYENLYDFRYDQQGQAEYLGPDATFNLNGTAITPTSPNQQVVKEYDGQGNLKKTRVRQPSLLDNELKQENLKTRKRKNFWDNLF